MKKQEMLELLTRLKDYKSMTFNEVKEAYQKLSSLKKHFKIREDYYDPINTNDFEGVKSGEILFWFGSWGESDFDNYICYFDSDFTPERIVQQLDFSERIEVSTLKGDTFILHQDSNGQRTWESVNLPSSDRDELLKLFKKLENHREMTLNELSQTYQHLKYMENHFSTILLKEGTLEVFKGVKKGKNLFQFNSNSCDRLSFKYGIYSYYGWMTAEHIVNSLDFSDEIEVLDEKGKRYLLTQSFDGKRNWTEL